ncbi:N-acetylmuramoyl-L-alanine amidase [Adonisia turfae]|uniref:N-acetylmuramoyl-L-alanine amidase n=1 Tax=Adonisia turfae CCMR0081 TaxID=2292702 RepID=A0A6M0RMJ7_9CYAN|nr:peptidoglycan recognition family protein [Adonisia turfae]NEZ57386.1 N-acetylmuramoyl-L-alanine amidase [Adonisia turfae CCMR0081]
MGDRRWFKIGVYVGAFCLAMVITMVLATTYKVFFGPPQGIAAAAPSYTVEATVEAGANVPSANHGLIYTAENNPTYRPLERVELADPSNYGERYDVDAYGQPLNHEFLAVLHETVWSANSAINTFQTYHPRDEDQVSYHSIIDRDGTVIYVVPPEKRAFGAGNSVFEGPNGPETAVTNPAFASSVNNFAYHISLVTPSDGQDNASTHSGYTDAQYKSLAWLMAQTTIPEARITTHAAVDRSGSRQDPRSFNWAHFLEYLHQYPSRAA